MYAQKKVTRDELAIQTKSAVDDKRTVTHSYPYYVEIGVIDQTDDDMIPIPGCRCPSCRSEE